MTVTALHSRTGLPLVGGYGPAQAAKAALTRDLSAELTPHGIRVVGLRPHGIPETSTMRELAEIRAKALAWARRLPLVPVAIGGKDDPSEVGHRLEGMSQGLVQVGPMSLPLG